ncbi:MAG: leucine-rich repeat protein, partial [Lachnospiraceae bacterium]|nr:leucine-rich repeat protein [Lachnospiraceae bacterium]
SSIPDNTLSGCNNLSWVKFPDGAQRSEYNPTKLFADVWGNPGFYVEGPETLDTPTSRSKPRETTWKAKAGNTGTENDPIWALTSVPYKFTDASGNVHFEIGVKENVDDTDPTYIATIDVIDESKKEAQLSEYFKYNQKDLTENIEITIPAMVGEYRVVAIADNCFNTDENLRNHIYRLNILDDSVREIKADAFKGMKELQWVFIGDAVEKIGASAFEDCNKLENVEFSQTLTGFYSDADWENALTIGSNAFKTGSEFLTFHGAINPAYAPYKLAMSEESSSMTSAKSKANICYKTDAPLHLTVIRDSDGKATLIDYPHYEEIDKWNEELIAEMNTDEDGNAIIIDDYSITEKFEIVNGIKDNDDNKNYQDTMGDMEGRVVEQVLNMELPAGIQNIDSRGYFTNDNNSNDFGYFNRIYIEVTSGDKVIGYKSDTLDRELNPFNGIAEKDVRKLYSTYEGLGTDEIKTVPGLFSGFFDESEIETGAQTYGFTSQDDTKFIWGSYRGHTYTENNNRGNDYLTSINMPTVENLQSYALDSNENVKEITIGRALNEIGVQPFRDCKSLWQIDTGDSTKYEFENMILYDKAPVSGSGGYKIVQGLEGRGRKATDGTYGSTRITADTNPLLAQVTDVAPYAFANNDQVVSIDLSKTNIRDIENGTFNGSSNLNEVILPEKTKLVGDFAFGGVNPTYFTLTVPNEDCQISQKAFQKDESDEKPSISGVIIKGISVDEDGDRSTAYDSFLKLQETIGKDNIEWREAGKEYTLRFWNNDTHRLIATVPVTVGEGETSATLNQPPEPPKMSGRAFVDWVYTSKDGTIEYTGADTYTNVTEDRDIYAMYKDDPTQVVPDDNDYTLTVENGQAMYRDPVTNESKIVSTFPISLKGGTAVTVVANNKDNFKVWTITPGTYTSLLTDANNFMTDFTMPNANVTVTANSAIGGSTDTPNPDGTYTVTVNNGTGGGNYRPGVTVTITANTAPTGQTFTNWTTTTASVSLTNPNNTSTTFVMPASNVTVTANYSGGNNQGGNTGDGNNNTTKYKVTVNYGSGSGEYAAGETVNIAANAPESSNRVFSRWTTSNSGLGFANANAVSTSFVMPATDVTVTANYRVRTSDDDDDDDSTSRRPGTNTSTSTVTNRPSSSTNTTGTTGTVNNPANGTSSTTSNNNGNRIYITKNGISNTDVASLAVSGSTDNFIVRITESEEATAAVEQALINTYGSLNGLAYLPMDISLYDSTGQNKITDTHGLNITVTMPIPDVLIQYGGNARVAAADNGVLQQLTPRFTTIDGIACISFVPPHFSPYVIYVDTNNLIAGQMLDSTPATGDPIHPKWFAAIGMACVSVLLFVLSDGRKRRKYRAA